MHDFTHLSIIKNLIAGSVLLEGDSAGTIGYSARFSVNVMNVVGRIFRIDDGIQPVERIDVANTRIGVMQFLCGVRQHVAGRVVGERVDTGVRMAPRNALSHQIVLVEGRKSVGVGGLE